MPRYSQLYLATEELARDCPRFRRRLQAVYEDIFTGTLAVEFGRKIEAKCGVDVVQVHTRAFVSWKSFFGHSEIRDILDSVTIGCELLAELGFNANDFLQQCKEVFSEEPVGYEIDDKGIVHPRFDAEFGIVRASLISALSNAKYTAAREHVSKAEAALLADPIDGRVAIRSTFDVVENVFKQEFVRVTHINSATLISHLKPRLQVSYKSDPHECRVAMKQLDAFIGWTNAVHFYRHESGLPEPNQPSLEITIHLVSLGFAFSRWLAELFRTR